jgi:hypothetical protein
MGHFVFEKAFLGIKVARHAFRFYHKKYLVPSRLKLCRKDILHDLPGTRADTGDTLGWIGGLYEIFSPVVLAESVDVVVVNLSSDQWLHFVHYARAVTPTRTKQHRLRNKYVRQVLSLFSDSTDLKILEIVAVMLMVYHWHGNL